MDAIPALALHAGRDGTGFEAFARAPKPLFTMQPDQFAAPNDESPSHSVNDHIPILDVEVEERLAVVVVPHEHRR